MSPLREIRPSTPDEVTLVESRRNRDNGRSGPRERNRDLVQSVIDQLKESGAVTLTYDVDDWSLANRTANMLRPNLQRKGMTPQLSIDQQSGQPVKLIITLAENVNQ